MERKIQPKHSKTVSQEFPKQEIDSFSMLLSASSPSLAGKTFKIITH